MSAPAHVVISKVPEADYLQNYVSPPSNFGSPGYYKREDVRMINQVVADNLSELDRQTHFLKRFTDRKVLIKPNLVTVFHDLGTVGRDYPETTDPRVLDAVVSFLKLYTREIIIVESSGRGIPTRGAFHQTGLDRLAKHHKIKFAALEEQPVDRYYLPKAKVMKEVAIPRIFSEVVRGEAFYISMPKMKTNLFTGVTLGFKNSMGILPYNLRQRNHNYALDQKLVDLMWLLQPDLTIIDGIIGGEGNCPAPVEPVQSRMIISGNHPTETDRAAIRMMGIDPSSIRLIQCADEMGFKQPDITITGESTPVEFKPADPLLTSNEFKKNFPNVKLLIGLPRALPEGTSLEKMTGEALRRMEMHCRGGCLAVTRYGFDMLRYEGHDTDFDLTVIIGDGIRSEQGLIYFDQSGNMFTLDDIRKLPRTLAVGTCTAPLKGMVSKMVPGCMPYPNSAHTALHQLTGTFCRILTPGNRYLIPLLIETLKTCERRKALIRRGERIDLPLHQNDSIPSLPALNPADQHRDWIPVEFEPLSRKQKRDLQKDENLAVLATFR